MTIVKNKLTFNHPLQLSIALSLMEGHAPSGEKIYVDFNQIAPIPTSVMKAFSGIHTQRLVWWHVTENAIDVKIDTHDLTITFQTMEHHPKGVILALHNKLPGGWKWEFASESPGFELGLYEANGKELTFYDMSHNTEEICANDKTYIELWGNSQERKDELS